MGRLVVIPFFPLTLFLFGRDQVFFCNLAGFLSSAAGKTKNPIQEN